MCDSATQTIARYHPQAHKTNVLGAGGSTSPIMRETEKWKALYNNRLKELVREKGITKKAFSHYKLMPLMKDGEPVMKRDGWFTKSIKHIREDFFDDVDAMSDRIKEAEEFADAVYKAMR